MVKQYIISINEEIKEYFDQSIQLIGENIKNKNLDISPSSVDSMLEKEISNFIYTSISIVDYYIDGIYNSGKLASRKKLNLKKEKPLDGQKYHFTKNDEEFIEKYKANYLTSLNNQLNKAMVKYLSHLIVSKIDDNDSSVYDEFFEVIVREVIVLFKRAQLEEYKNLGITKITFISNDSSYSCPICNAKSGKIFDIDDVISNFGVKDGIRHAFCKYSIDPITINLKNQLTIDDVQLTSNFEIKDMHFVNVPIEIESRIKNIIKKIQIYSPSFLKKIEFKFVDNIVDLTEWEELIKQHYMNNGESEQDAENELIVDKNNLKDRISSFSLGNIVYISLKNLDFKSIETLILRELFKNQLVVSDDINEMFKEKKESKYIGYGVAFYQSQFINYLAEETPENYLLESVVAYIADSNKLKTIDNQIYEYIKNNVFEQVEF